MMYSIFCVVPCADVTCIEYFLIDAVTKERMKSKTRFLTTLKIFWHLCFILEFTAIISILFFEINRLCCVALI